jgi:uncharacterized coiled-coil DUF342 family protein
MEIIEANMGMMESELKKWGEELDALADKATDACAETEIEYRKQINDLKAKHQAAQAKIREVKSAGSGSWKTFKNGVETAWNELESAFKKMKN